MTGDGAPAPTWTELFAAIEGPHSPLYLSGDDCRSALAYLLDAAMDKDGYVIRAALTKAVGHAQQLQAARVEREAADQAAVEPTATESILPDPMSATEVAEFLHVDTKTVDDWVRSGALRSHLSRHGFRRFDTADVRALLGEQTDADAEKDVTTS